MTTDVHLAAVATKDPFGPRTFSGYSRRLFSELALADLRITPIVTGTPRWYDVLGGAVNVRGLARGHFSGRYAPKINPRWVWSRAGYERATRRFSAALAAVPDLTHTLQVGTHVRAVRPGLRSYCVTDCTVVQALAAGEFSVSQGNDRVAEEAIECQREVFLSCEKVFVLSRWAAESVERDYGVSPTRIAVVGSGPNVTRPQASLLSPSAQTTPDPYILFVGFDWEQKGGPLLLEACRLLRRDGSRARLVVVGCRPQVNDDFVDVVGPLNTAVAGERKQLEGLYAGARCFALLSDFDCFPMVILEAGLMGVPTVSTNQGSRPEVILDGITGVLASDRTATAVANVLRPLLADGEAAAAMGSAARDYIEARYTWPNVIERMLTEMGIHA